MHIDGSLAHAAQHHEHDAYSQYYLWMLSRLDTAKLVQRSIQAANTPHEVKMVVAEYNLWDRLPSGCMLRDSFDGLRGGEMLREMVPGACAYVRRKPTYNGLSHTRYQIVLVWNCKECS